MIRVGIADSGVDGAAAAKVIARADFFAAGTMIGTNDLPRDHAGHGSALAAVIAEADGVALLDARIFDASLRASAAQAAAAIDWLVESGARLINLSFGLREDRGVLREACARAVSGGVLLGVASAMFILLNGRILGISGILGGLLPPKLGDSMWRIAFLAGMFCAPVVFNALAPAGFATTPRVDADGLSVVAAGLLVGIGTRYASGCTSGHGVCGLSRLSPRSLVATMSFMGAGFLVVYLVRHII